MVMERRGFFGKVLAAGAGLVVVAKGIKAWAAGLPSDPGYATEAAGADVIALPQFEKNSGFSLDDALLGRKTDRDYDGKAKLSLEQISRLLWATNGVNRLKGHGGHMGRTTPSAVFSYPIEVYAALHDGVYRFETEKHQMVRVLTDDIRDKCPSTQPGLKRAAMTLLFVINKKDVPGKSMEYAHVEVGCMVQNLFLEAVAMGMGSCVFALVRFKKVTQILGLKENQKLLIAHAVGPLKKK